MFTTCCVRITISILLVIIVVSSAPPACNEGETKADRQFNCKRYKKCGSGKWQDFSCDFENVFNEGKKKCEGGTVCPNQQPSGILALTNILSLLGDIDQGAKEPGVMLKDKDVPPTPPLVIPESVRKILITDCGVAGKHLESMLKITGGKTANIKDFPWQIAILDRKSMELRCGGSIVSKQHVLSATHCFLKGGGGRGRGRVPKENFVISAGSTSFNDPKRHLYNISQLYIHDGYSSADRQHDIALLKLDRPFEFGDKIHPVCLPGPNHKDIYRENVICSISGWGKTSTNDTEPSVELLNAVKIKITSLEDCKRDNEQYLAIGPGMFCAGDLKYGKYDSCQGDSGGPFVCTETARGIVVGVTSWGIGCGLKQHPGVYTKVADYLPWLYEKLEQSMK